VPFWRCYYHVVWATHGRQPLMTPDVEQIIHETIIDKSLGLACHVIAMSGTADHIHVAVNIPPKLAVSTWVGRVKGASARNVNERCSDQMERFRWQSSYGVLTFGQKNLPFVVAYIQAQKQHHQQSTLVPYLERIE